jgi:hypothetical protein
MNALMTGGDPSSDGPPQHGTVAGFSEKAHGHSAIGGLTVDTQLSFSWLS